MNVQQLIPVWQAFQSLAPITHIENDIPVSYTHLDVYKRQV